MDAKVNPNKKKLLLRTVFMFFCMGVPMQLIVNLVPGISMFPSSLIITVVGMIGGMSANFAWEYIWAKVTGRVEI